MHHSHTGTGSYQGALFGSCREPRKPVERTKRHLSALSYQPSEDTWCTSETNQRYLPGHHNAHGFGRESFGMCSRSSLSLSSMGQKAYFSGLPGYCETVKCST